MPSSTRLALLALVAVTVAAALPRRSRAEAPAAADGPGVGAWIRQRIDHAKKGTREIVELPIVRASDGWGCTCPDFYVGTDPDSSSNEDAWLEPTAASLKKLPRATKAGYVEIVDGYFTGKTSTFKGDDPSHPYHPAEFVVTRVVRAYRDGHAGDSALKVVKTETVRAAKKR